MLNKVDVSAMPPFGEYVGPGGLTKKVFEGLMCNIDAKIQLYTLVKGGNFNARGAGHTLENEAFFNFLSEQDPTHLGCPKSTHIGRMMASVTEMHHYRHNPEM